MRGLLLALVLVLAADDLVALTHEATDDGALQELDAVRLRLGEILKLGHQGVGDGHACYEG